MSFNPVDEKKIGCAILGISNVARLYAVRLQRMANIRLITAWGRDHKRSMEFAKEFGLEAPPVHLETVMTDPRVDALLILTEPSRHVALARTGIAAGKHLLIEKPLALHPMEARELVRDTQDSALTLGIVSQMRFHPRLLEMKQTLNALPENTPKLAMLSILWRRDENYFRHGTGWRCQESAVLINQGIHWLDVLNWFFGPPCVVHGHSFQSRPFLACPDFSTAMITYPGQTQAMVGAATFCDQGHADRLEIHHPGGSLHYTPHGNPLPVGWRERLAQWLKRQSLPSGPGFDLLQRQLDDFFAAIRQKRPPRVTLQDGLLALELAVAASGDLSEQTAFNH